MATIGLSNIQIKNVEGKFVPLGKVEDIKLEVESDPPEWLVDISKPISISSTIRAKRNGTIFERCLHYKKNKKKRIRKKWDLGRKVFGNKRREQKNGTLDKKSR